MGFAFGCGLVAMAVAVASGGLTFGAGYNEAKSLLQDHPGRGLSLAVSKFVASLAASASGVPGGIFAPSLATGAGIGAAWKETLGRNFPPSTLLYISGLVDQRCKVEIEVTAFVPAG